jgi:hypothetical protein
MIKNSICNKNVGRSTNNDFVATDAHSPAKKNGTLISQQQIYSHYTYFDVF